MAQHCDPPYRAIGCSYTYRIYFFFQGIAGYRAIPPPPQGGGIAQLCCFETTGGGGVSQVKAAVSAIGRFRGVSQLYCRKLRFNGPRRNKYSLNSRRFFVFKGIHKIQGKIGDDNSQRSVNFLSATFLTSGRRPQVRKKMVAVRTEIITI